MFIKIIMLVALLQLLAATDKPFLCSGIYTVIVFVFSLITGLAIIEVLIICAISFSLASLYFWLLDRFRESMAYWGILVVGLLIGMV